MTLLLALAVAMALLLAGVAAAVVLLVRRSQRPGPSAVPGHAPPAPQPPSAYPIDAPTVIRRRPDAPQPPPG